MENKRVLRVEVSAGEDAYQEQNAHADGGHECAAGGKKPIPVTSLDKLTRLLSGRNMWLLNLIRKSEPQSVAELARLSGRPKASLTLTLRRLESFGIIKFREISGRRKVPLVVCDKLMLEVSLEPTHAKQTADESPRQNGVSSESLLQSEVA